jgi:hypothetical protein
MQTASNSETPSTRPPPARRSLATQTLANAVDGGAAVEVVTHGLHSSGNPGWRNKSLWRCGSAQTS